MRPYTKVGWFTQNVDRRAKVWRLLDLSGMTSSVRQSRDFTKRGYVYLDNSNITSTRAEVALGEVVTLEIRFPNGVVQSKRIMVVPITRHPGETPRLNVPQYTRRRG